METEPKECPFCGSVKNKKLGWMRYCYNCQASVGGRAWNRRAIPECVRKLQDAAMDAAFKLACDGHQEQANEVTAAANAVTEHYEVTE